jgi:hypothetical protein
MNRILGLVMAGGLILGHAPDAEAQFSLSIGNPYTGGIQIGQPYAYGGTTYYGSGYSDYVAPPTTYYGSGYSDYVAPPTTYYGSGYSGYSSYVAPGTTYFQSGTYTPYPYTYGVPAYRAPVVVPYRSYVYGPRRGFGRPFRGRWRW